MPHVDKRSARRDVLAMRILGIILLTMVAGLSARADEDRLPTLTAGDTIYTNVQVLLVTPTDIYFSADNGIGNVKLTNLDSTLQAKFAPYAAKASEVDQKQTAANTAYERTVAAQEALAPPPETGPDSTKPPINSASTNAPLAKTLLDKKGPDLVVEKWLSASPNMAGKFVMVEFWSPANMPCLNFIPTLNHYAEEFADKMVIVGIADEPEDNVRKVVDPNIGYYSAFDSQKRMEADLDVKVVPYVLLMDPQGIVRWEGNPMKDGNSFSDSVITGILNKYNTAAQ